MDQNNRWLLGDSLFEDGPVVAFRWLNEPGWPVLDVSSNVSQFGYSAEEFRSGRMSYSALVHPDDLDRVAQEVEAHIDARNPRFKQVYRVVCADGRVHTVLDHTVLVLGGDGQVEHMQGYILDRTELEEAMRESEQRSTQLLLALEGSGTGLWDLRLPDGEIILDAAGQSLAGMGPSQPVTHIGQWLELIHPDDRERVEDALNEHLAGGTPMLRQELQLARPGGDWHWLLLNGRVVERDEHGAALRLLGTVHDIHGARHQIEQENLRREQALRLAKMASLEQVAAGVAHRFNNLLAAILGNIEFMQLDSALPPELGAVLARIQESAIAASDLSQSLLSYTGNRLIRMETVDSRIWLKDQVEPWCTAAGCRIHLDLDPALPEISLDLTQVHQAVRHVLANAVEAGAPEPVDMRARVHTEVEAGRRPVVGVHPTLDGPYLVLRIKDSGPGMSEEQLERVFDPFFTTHFVGRGLGMATVRGVMMAHRGGIQVHSRPREGTVVDLYFPINAS